jgi:hypothetical protein
MGKSAMRPDHIGPKHGAASAQKKLGKTFPVVD